MCSKPTSPYSDLEKAFNGHDSVCEVDDHLYETDILTSKNGKHSMEHQHNQQRRFLAESIISLISGPTC